MTRCLVGMVTCPSRTVARKLAKSVLSKRLVACVNIVDGIESHYWWEDKLEQANECLLIMKTTKPKANQLVKTIKAEHPYDIPEIIFYPIDSGEKQYLTWIREAVKSVAVVAALTILTITVHAEPTDDLINRLSDPDGEVRAESASTLATIGGPVVRKQFRTMLDSDNPEFRQMAAVGLLQVSDQEKDIKQVATLLEDENSNVRWTAALALGHSGYREAIQWLEPVEKSDTSESVRQSAGESIQMLRKSPHWRRSLAETLKEAKDLNKPVFAYFTLRGSEYCRQLEQHVLVEQAVADALQEFVCLRINASDYRELSGKYDVRGAPTILILDENGNETTRIQGLIDSDMLLAKLADSRAGYLAFKEARRLAVRDQSNIQANWKVAQVYLEEDREDMAIPYLKNIIQHDNENLLGHTDNALFALGFAYGKKQAHAQAVQTMEYLLNRWPEFKDKDKALYCLGLSSLATGNQKKGRAALEELIRIAPQSSSAASARQAISKLNTTVPSPNR